MKLTAIMLNGTRLDWDEPDTFNLPVAVAHWRAMGYMQAPNFYVNMTAVAIVLTGSAEAKFNLPAGQMLQ